MNYYTLIKSNGKIEVFSIKECAEIFQRAFGGVLFCNSIVNVELEKV
jgi:hypothetical protein